MTVREPTEEQERRGKDQREPGPVEGRQPARQFFGRHEDQTHQHCRETKRQGQVEQVTPAHVVDGEAAENGTEGGREDGAEPVEPDRHTAFLRWEDAEDGKHRKRLPDAGRGTLQNPPEDQ